jgi:penicillin-binding protein 2
MALQKDVEQTFRHVTIKNDDGTVEKDIEMHGAAVLIDVASGGVIAMASSPTFDLNAFNELYPQLQRDELNKPLMNRATQWALEPGSTVKPITGLGAITDSRLLVHQGIECTGYLVHRGHKITEGFRCWTASKFAGTQYDALVAHHQIPSPGHRGHHGNPDGFLTLSDALERSCNVYFETAAGMMGVGGLRKWYDRFGLGRPTGVGIPEWSGRIPNPEGLPYAEVQRATWFAGIGQGQMSATTIQMANVAATIARDGVWVRPQLISAEVPTTRPAGVKPVDGPARVDLGIPPAAIAAAKAGMINVMYGDGGTANHDIALPPVRMAGKTGTAETKTQLRTRQRDSKGEIVKLKEPVFNSKGTLIGEKLVTQYDYYEPVSPQNRAGAPSWYRGFGPDGKKLKHAWFIGFAPVERPKVAIAVMVEYGGSGGSSALSVASGALNACIKHGYLEATSNVANASAAAAR